MVGKPTQGEGDYRGEEGLALYVWTPDALTAYVL